MSGAPGLLIASAPPPAAGTVLSRWNGWIPETHTWTYASTDTHTFVVTVPADITAYVGLGAKIWCVNQGASQYFFVTAISVTAGVTTVTLYGGTGYSLTNTPITNVQYSWADAPIGFPRNPTNWTETFTDTVNRTKTGPTSLTWYWSDLGSPAVVLPIGLWWVRYSFIGVISTGATTVAGVSMVATLSTSNSAPSDATMNSQIFGNSNLVTNQEQSYVGNLTRGKSYNATVKTTLYVIAQTQNSTVATLSIEFANANGTGVISASSAYL